MAIYHFTAKVIKRSQGRSAVAAAAYRAGDRFYDETLERSFDYSYKSEVIHSEIILPTHAPEWMHDRQRLWNAVEARELRTDAQVAREVEFALPQELSQAEAIGLARAYVQAEFVERGMIADLNLHWEPDNPHAHVMLTMREITGEGFGRKVREWNSVELLREWRQHWAEHANERLHELGFDIRIDHRSYREQGIELEPTRHLGRAVDEMRGRGEYAERALELEEVRERNARRIEQQPELVLEQLTRRQSTFTRNDLAREIFRYIDDGERFRQLLGRIEASHELVLLAPEVKDRDRQLNEPARYTTRELLGIESRLAERALELAQEHTHDVSEQTRERVLERHDYLSEEQREAVRHITSERDIEALTGFAGSGKSAAIAAARELWEAAGYQVWGAALSGIAAENLERAAGVRSRTLASLELGWSQGRERLNEHDIIVLDEAGMVGSRQMERLVSEVYDRGAKLVLVGDAEQLQPIEAGAAFRAIAERVGYRELAGIRRQELEWQREASRDFALGEPGKALELYHEHDAIHFTQSRERAKDELIRLWGEDRAAPEGAEKATLILAHTRADVRDLNERARDILQARHELGREVTIAIEREILAADGTLTRERGERRFAPGERVMFLQNNRELGVKNGSLGEVLEITPEQTRVRLDGRAGREIEFSFSDYAALDYGYAATVHKAQGATVERSYVLATPGMDRHLAYVGLTRHREGLELFAGHDDFADFSALEQRLSRARLKDFTLDYAHRRGLGLERERTPDDRRREAQLELERKLERLREAPELAFGLELGKEHERAGRSIRIGELAHELGGRLPEYDGRVADQELERGAWLGESLGGRSQQFWRQALGERELGQAAYRLIGGRALEQAVNELDRAQERLSQAERELEQHWRMVEQRPGLERVIHVFGDLNREKQLRTLERQASLERQEALNRYVQIEHWLEQPAQQRQIYQRLQELRGQDRQLLRELQLARTERDQLRELQQELARCPEQERELKLQGRSFELRELQRDAGFQREIGALREQRLARERELACEQAHERELRLRGITPRREFRRGHDRDAADEAWARHAAEKGLGLEHIRDELLKERPRKTPRHEQERELERLTQLAQREVQRARSLDRDRGFGWSR
jgi:Ti-type conjugative transfer relaxase TraA